MAKSDVLKLIGHSFPVLDSGHIRVVDALGDDSAIVQAARVAYGAGTKTPSDDRTLIRYLMRHRHTTPIEMCILKLHVRCPMDVWRQWIRHRTAHVNEYSTRYSEAIDEKMATDPGAWRNQSATNKQGSGEFIGDDVGQWLTDRESWFHDAVTGLYRERLDHGVAREQARKDLPLSTYTEAYWMIDLHNLFHFLGLRIDSHAQWEIRQYANIIGTEIVAKWVPYAWEAWLEYRHHAVGLSKTMADIVFEWNRMNAGTPGYSDGAKERIWNMAVIAGWIKPISAHANGWFTYPRNRERDEIEALMQRLGMPILWRKPYAETS